MSQGFDVDFETVYKPYLRCIERNRPEPLAPLESSQVTSEWAKSYKDCQELRNKLIEFLESQDEDILRSFLARIQRALQIKAGDNNFDSSHRPYRSDHWRDATKDGLIASILSKRDILQLLQILRDEYGN